MNADQINQILQSTWSAVEALAPEEAEKVKGFVRQQAITWGTNQIQAGLNDALSSPIILIIALMLAVKFLDKK